MILVLHMHDGDRFVYARTEDELAAAYLHLFNHMDAAGYFDCPPDGLTKWEELARGGDAQAAKELLELCSRKQYEGCEIDKVCPVVPIGANK